MESKVRQLDAAITNVSSESVQPTEITVIDLFAGAGGFTAGFHAASDRYRTVRAVEWDSAAAASYEATFGKGIVFFGSIQDWLETEQVPQVDLIVGGPPCQGFSTLGKRDAEDERNALWREYMDTIIKAKPKYFVVENVAAFASSPQYGLFKRETEEGGQLQHYTFQHRVLNAADYGAPQARKRTVIIGHLRTLPFPGWPEPTHVGKHRSVRDAFEEAEVPAKPDGIDLPSERHVEVDGKELAGPFTRKDLHLGRRYTQLSKDRFKEIDPGGNRFDLARKRPDLLPKCWIEHTTGSADVMGRLSWDKPSVTIRTEFFKPEKGRYLHPVEDRAITHYEAAVLQGFPPEHKFVGSKTAIARQIGNAVPIPLGRAIAELLLDFL
ncbi:DNA cytosine methyltransferase [uncultured Microbacterium sp.]|uniref:DNA cytosine methyltransferase n=1 Tax=uncultured Microbacterium sp. TaxID=191216 RepID=UPI00262F8663|nr:DNA cytosine methyltransferase [uncultured Microbacterium sp.]